MEKGYHGVSTRVSCDPEYATSVIPECVKRRLEKWIQAGVELGSALHLIRCLAGFHDRFDRNRTD
jgi:hypothetical protein